MMLPVIGVETRAIMRTKVVQVMRQVSSRLTNYEAVRRVVRTAIDDAGLLPVVEETQATSSRSLGRRRSRSGRRDHLRRIQYADSDGQDDDGDSSGKGSEDENDGDDGGTEEEEGDKDSAWFRLPTALQSSSRPNSGQDSSGNVNTEVDESQIPVVADAAMEAVLDYASEILNPILVIHQLTEAIQSALYHIRKLKTLQHFRGDDIDLDINVLSSQSLADRHGLDLLSDDWIWPSSITADDKEVEDDEGEPDTDSRGQDEDLWDKDMESRDWDSVGHLFEDFEDEKDNKDANSDTEATTSSDTEQESWELVRDDDGDDSKNPFTIGIQEEEDTQQDELYDEMLDGEYDYESDGSQLAGDSDKQTYLNRFNKRSLLVESTVAQVDEEDSVSGVESLSSASSSSRERGEPAFLTKRWPSFTPDPRLEILLAQLIEPMLTAFIDEDFPSTCKRSQGELMDGIIWSLDQSDASGNTREQEQDQLALLSELEY
ncbi:hypothetical protein BGZ58_002037 [Dissophora ornata]|nr:hypothetical protein BGZ58_002037 [Dissophora ornata]